MIWIDTKGIKRDGNLFGSLDNGPRVNISAADFLELLKPGNIVTHENKKVDVSDEGKKPMERIHLKNFNVEGRLQFKKYNTSVHVIFLNCHFKNHVFFSDSKSNSIISFHDSFLDNRITLDNFEVDCFFLSNTIVRSEIQIANKSKMNNEFYIGYGGVMGLDIAGVYINQLRLLYPKIDKLDIRFYQTLIDFLELDGLKSSQINLTSGAVINKILIRRELDSSSTLNVDGIHINKLEFNEFINKGSVIFVNNIVEEGRLKTHNKKIIDILSEEQIYQIGDRAQIEDGYYDKIKEKTISELNGSDYNNLGGSKIYAHLHKLLYEIDSTDQSIIKIVKSDMGETYFKNFPFSNFESIEIVDSELNNTRYFNSFIPIHKVKGTPLSLYEVFNDLHNISLKRNNKRESVEYYKGAQKNILRFSLHKWYKKIPSILSLGTSYVFSNYGTRWLQALGLTLLFGVIIFSSMMLFSHYDFDWTFTSKSVDNFVALISYYFQYLNPTHRVNFMDSQFTDLSQNNWFVGLDFCGRILISIGIFETVKSFRKYHNR